MGGRNAVLNVCLDVAISEAMKPEISIICGYYKVGKLLGIMPVETKSNKTRRLLNKSYIISLLLIVIGGTTISLISRYSHFLNGLPITQSVLDFLDALSETLFMVVSFIGALKQRKHWKMFWKNTTKLECILNKQGFKDNTNLRICLLRVVTFHVFYFALNTYEIVTWLDHNSTSDTEVENGYYLSRIIMYYQFFVVLFIICVAKFLRIRYKFVRIFLEEYLKSSKRTVIITEDVHKSMNLKLNAVREIYSILYSIVRIYNQVFGWAMFFTVVSNVTVCLGSMNYILQFSNTSDEEFNIGVLSVNVIYSIVYTSATVAIIMSCESLEQEGENIVRVCLLYQDVLEKGMFREDIVLFMDFVKILSPNFSAAGFFTINQKLLSGLFSAMITYLIIIIQFNMTKQ